MSVLIRTADYQIDGVAIRAIRREVFCGEQKIPEALDFDGRDATAQHWLVEMGLVDRGTQAVATVRSRTIAPDTHKIERLAVLPSHRRRGIALALMEFVLKQLQQQGGKTVVVHAQGYIQPLYDRLQFLPEGDRFVEAGIEHVKMVRCI